MKTLIRDLLPPLLLRWIAAIRKARTVSSDRLTIKRYGDSSVFLSDGSVLAHRATQSDLGVIRQIFEACDYSLDWMARHNDIHKIYEACNKPLILDCGANIGASPRWFSAQYPRASVVAVEPAKDNFELLQRNVRGISQIMPILGGVAGKPGSLVIQDVGQGEWGYRTSAGTGPEAVRAFTLDELVTSSRATPFILKVDIEGGESDLFSEPSDVLGRFPVIIIELHDWLLPRSASSRPFLVWHAKQDRDFLHRGENVFSILNDAP